MNTSLYLIKTFIIYLHQSAIFSSLKSSHTTLFAHFQTHCFFFPFILPLSYKYVLKQYTHTLLVYIFYIHIYIYIYIYVLRIEEPLFFYTQVFTSFLSIQMQQIIIFMKFVQSYIDQKLMPDCICDKQTVICVFITQCVYLFLFKQKNLVTNLLMVQIVSQFF